MRYNSSGASVGGSHARRRHQQLTPQTNSTTSLYSNNETTVLDLDDNNAKPTNAQIPPTYNYTSSISYLPTFAQNRANKPPTPPLPPIQHSDSGSKFNQFGQLITSTANWWIDTIEKNEAHYHVEAINDESIFDQEPPFKLPPDEMPCRERTQEFRTIAKSAQMRQASMANGHVNQQRPQRMLVQDSIEFNRQSKVIGHHLSQTCAKLEKLAELAKKKTLFDEDQRNSEIEQLTGVVKADIQGLNRMIAQLQQYRASNQSHHKAQDSNHAKSIVVGLQSRLATASKEFKRVLEVRTASMKSQKQRKEQFGNSRAPKNLPPNVMKGATGSLLLNDDIAASTSSQNGQIALDMSQMQQFYDQSTEYSQDRLNTMETIEKSISDLGSIFKQLADMVSIQGETIQRIDMNVEATELNVEAAHMELLKYFQNISKNRWLFIKVFGVLIMFFIIFVLFLA